MHWPHILSLRTTFKQVIIINRYAGLNLKELQPLGRGTQGKVYKIDSQRCIKVFRRKQDCKDEFEALMMAQMDSHFPRIYSAGEDYIIRECIEGIQLNKYLIKNELTPLISEKIIRLYESLEIVGFRRLDSTLTHIFLTPSGEIKIIDTAKAMKIKIKYPRLLLKGLGELGHKKEFLDFVKCIKPDLYRRW